MVYKKVVLMICISVSTCSKTTHGIMKDLTRHNTFISVSTHHVSSQEMVPEVKYV
jgi:hypothetical protein